MAGGLARLCVFSPTVGQVPTAQLPSLTGAEAAGQTRVSVSGHLLAHKWIDHGFISSKLYIPELGGHGQHGALDACGAAALADILSHSRPSLAGC